MEWLKPAIVFMALSSVVVAASFFYVGASLIRRRYVFLWAFAWVASIPQLACSWWLLDHPRNDLIWTAQQSLLALNTLLIAGGCYEFVHRRFPLRPLVALGSAFLTWAAVAPRVFDHFLAIQLPGSILFGMSYLWAASRFLHLHRQGGTRGARLLAILLALAGIHEMDYPLLGASSWTAPAGFALAAMLALAVGLGLLVMVLEESRADAERQRAKIGAILEDLPVGVVVTDTEGQIEIVNRLARDILPGARPGLEKPIHELEAEVFREPDGQPCASARLPVASALCEGVASSSRELSMSASAGDARAVLVSAGPLRDAQGASHGAMGVFQDIQEMKRMQAEIARSQKLQGLGTLAAGVAHDFNNALTMILGHTELALNSATTGPARTQLEIVRRVASDSAAIVRRLQDVARTRAVRGNVTFDLAAVVRDAVEITRPRWRDEAHSRGLSFNVRTRIEAEAPIAGQPEEIREVLLNLTFNALDAMPAGGELEFSVELTASEAVLRVRDSGTGMPPEVRERIFDPFFTTKGQRGNGLGLAVVFGIVERHRARILVDSTPGRGTCFSLRFPLAPRAGLERSEPEGRERCAASAPPRPGLRVLVVDDEALVCNLTAALLRGVGHTVETVGDGSAALALCAQRPFDLVLTDLGMPGMNGWEVAEQISRQRPETRVVLVTGWGDTISAEAETAAGVARVLPKPFTRVQLLACIDEVSRPAEPAAVA